MLKKELTRFLVTGCSAVATDYLTYLLFQQWFDLSLAKGLSFVAGSVLAFILNKYWTFEVHHSTAKQLVKFTALYLSTLAANVSVNAAALQLLPEFITFAFLCATGTSTILNFLGQKFWVFITPIPPLKDESP
ncbi:MAG: GtrA family protein [SAR324 cluster bacterium]|nr:GtrA family protein [SAR324 cluster bacterium]